MTEIVLKEQYPQVTSPSIESQGQSELFPIWIMTRKKVLSSMEKNAQTSLYIRPVWLEPQYTWTLTNIGENEGSRTFDWFEKFPLANIYVSFSRVGTQFCFCFACA